MENKQGDDAESQKLVALTSGTLLSHYRVIERIGAGGMGEVYRAQDTRLGRDVAIKVLSPHLAATPEVRARFEREARTISQLNHPHICTLYDVGRHEGMDYLVMELLEGKTLAHRLEKGPLPVAEVLSLGAEIAEALDVAHRRGIVHRDLKPGNVMLTNAGAKLMDFGLARASAISPAAGAEAESPTVSRPLTSEGTIVGTFQYMAPEQLEGKEADARTDIWALGCVLYEMATGKFAFEGTSQASLIAAILKEMPRPIMELQPLTPPALDHLVKGCLAKDPDARWQSAGDLARELQWIAEAGSQATVPTPIASRKLHRERIAWAALAATMAVTIAILVLTGLASHAPAPTLARLAITLPEGGAFPIESASAAISPDGKALVFTCVDSAATQQRLWIRSLGSSAAQLLPGTEDAGFPFWSPDSRFVGFFASGKLRKVPVGGGPPETICDAPNGRGGSWSKHDVIILAPLSGGPIQRVSPDGGEAVTVARPDSARGETALRFPCFLPDGRHFLYVSLPKRQGQYDVYVGDLDSGETRHVMVAGSAPVYTEPGYLLFESGGRLVAQRFDRSKLCPVGRVIPLGDAPSLLMADGAPILCPPAKGVLVHVTSMISNTELTWLDRTGRPTGTIPLPPGRYEYPTLSPNDRWVAVTKHGTATGGDLWVVDLERDVPSRLTFDGSVASGTVGSPWPWSPDGDRIAYTANPSGPWCIYQVAADGTGRPEPLLESGELFKFPVSWSPDGTYIVCYWFGGLGGMDVWLLPLEGDRTPAPYLRTRFDESDGRVSPNGRWLAYESNETGTMEQYVSSFPILGERYRITTSGDAAYAQWSKDGRELIVYTWPGNIGCGPVLSVNVQTAPTFKAEPPRMLFTPPRNLAGLVATSDLKRFLAAVPVEGSAQSITVILNWEAALKQ